jgi:hypothetical protein
MPVTTLRAIYRIKVTLKGIRPPIWRRLLVSNSLKLSEFHKVLQSAMGWRDIHLHQFIVGQQNYGLLNIDGPDDTLNERRYTLGDLLKAEQDCLLYEYDFGDGWQHQVVLEKIMPFELHIALPQCLKGKRACPPEDVGGPWGYREFLEVLGDPGHPQHGEMLGWVGGAFDPEAFDAAGINQRLLDNR